MNKTILAFALASLLGTTAQAQEAASPFSANIGVTSDYRYRGISQSRLKPAVQGGVDYALPAGFYIGAWASTIKWIRDIPGGDARVEIDLYGGFKGEIVKDLSYDVGVLGYVYPGNNLGNVSGFKNANTVEIYGALTYGPVTAKYSHAVTNTFGNPDSKNSFYFDLSAGFPLGWDLTLTPHVGYQKIKGPYADGATYTDYSIALSKDFSGFLVSAAIVGTDADKDFYVPGANANSSKFLGKTAGVLSVKYTF